jgi:hypothetical protein
MPTTTTNKKNNPKTEVKLRVSCGREAPFSKLEANPIQKKTSSNTFLSSPGHTQQALG